MENEQKIDENEISKMREAVLKSITPKKIIKQDEKKNSQQLTIKNEQKNVKVAEKISKKALRINKSKFLKIFFIVIIFILLSLSFTQAYLTIFKPQNFLIEKITRIIPFPAAFVNARVITYHEWLSQVIALDQFYQSIDVDATNSTLLPIEQSESRIMERLIEEEMLRQFANQFSVTVSEEEVDQEMSRLFDLFGKENFLNQINEKYKWDSREFEKFILKPTLLKNKLSIYLLNHPGNQQAKLLAQNLLNKLENKEDTFENIAQSYSQDESAKDGGQIGYFELKDMNPEIKNEISQLKVGEISKIINTKFGFHILRIDEILLDDDGQPAKVKISQILIKAADLNEYMDDFKKNSSIWILIKFDN